MEIGMGQLFNAIVRAVTTASSTYNSAYQGLWESISPCAYAWSVAIKLANRYKNEHVFNAGPITAQSVEISLPISLGVFVPIIVILIALLVLLIVLYISAIGKKKETSARIAQLQSRVMELSSVYEELDPRASVLLHDSDNSMEKMMDNKAYSVPRKATQKIVDSEATLGQAYEIMRSVSRQ